MKPSNYAEPSNLKYEPDSAIHAVIKTFSECYKASVQAKNQFNHRRLPAVASSLNVRRVDLLESMLIDPSIQKLVDQGRGQAETYAIYRTAFLSLLDDLAVQQISYRMIEREAKRMLKESGSERKQSPSASYFGLYPDIAEAFGIKPGMDK